LSLKISCITTHPLRGAFTPHSLKLTGTERSIHPSFIEAYRNSHNVITAAELEAMLNPASDFGGLILRPYDGEIPETVVLMFLNEFKEFKGLKGFEGFEGLEELGLVHLAKLALYVRKNFPDISAKLLTDTTKVGPLPEGYEHLGDGAKVLEELGEDAVHIPDLIIEENPDEKVFTITYTDKNSQEENLNCDLVVISSKLGTIGNKF
jgi:heterodisulfide reductase subunit A-like polyferredoxin